MSEEPEKDKKPGSFKAFALWTYWQVIMVVWSIVKAIRDMKRK